MMNKCLNSEKEIISIEGRRAKKYCDNKGKCKGEYFRKLKKVADFVPKSKYDDLNNRYNQLINATRGKDENGVNNDEVKVTDLTKPNKEVKVKIIATTNYSIDTLPKNLNDLKDLCPKELNGFEKSDWISQNRVKYGI